MLSRVRWSLVRKAPVFCVPDAFVASKALFLQSFAASSFRAQLLFVRRRTTDRRAYQTDRAGTAMMRGWYSRQQNSRSWFRGGNGISIRSVRCDDRLEDAMPQCRNRRHILRRKADFPAPTKVGLARSVGVQRCSAAAGVSGSAFLLLQRAFEARSGDPGPDQRSRVWQTHPGLPFRDILSARWSTNFETAGSGVNRHFPIET